MEVNQSKKSLVAANVATVFLLAGTVFCFITLSYLVLHRWDWLRSAGPLDVPLMALSPAERNKIAARYSVKLDTRHRDEVIEDLRAEGVDAVPLVTTTTDPNIVPLGSVSRKVTVVCNQTGQYMTYTSDEHGFHNPPGMWSSASADIVTVGNSFTPGTCVPSDKSFVSLIRKEYSATLNLGMQGQGPLHILGVLQEYAQFLRPKVVLWFYAEGATFEELSTERRIPILMRYLTTDLRQDLLSRQDEINAVLGHELETKPRSISASQPSKSAIPEVKATADFNLFRDALFATNRRVNGWGGKLYFVYLPAWARYAKSPAIGVAAREQVVQLVRDLGIPLVDIYEVFDQHGDPLSLFPFRGPGQYNEEGHRLVAHKVLETLIKQLK